MGTYDTHLNNYKSFKKDAENPLLFNGTRVEAYFLAAFHLIETCAAKYRVHINKHQNVRYILEKNATIFSTETEIIWRAFQRIENQLRPKIIYGVSWTAQDFQILITTFSQIEQIGLKVIT